jgi:hypothetical protein
MCCSDGVVIRYERKEEETTVLGDWVSEGVAEIAPVFSQDLIHCYSNRIFTSTVATTALEIVLAMQDPTRKETEVIASARIGLDVVVEKPEVMLKPPQKPF